MDTQPIGAAITASERKQTRESIEVLEEADPQVFIYEGKTVTEIVSATASIYAKALCHYLKLLAYDRDEAGRRAAALWRAALPELVDNRTTLAYIACIAWGMKLGALSGVEAKGMMYIAQTQLTVLRMEAIEDEPDVRPPKLADRTPPSGHLFPTPAQTSMEP